MFRYIENFVICDIIFLHYGVRKMHIDFNELGIRIKKRRRELNLKVRDALLQSNTPFAKSLKYIDMANVPDTQKYAMVERHIISPEFANNTADTAIILSDDESISIMIGEEDHIRIQVIYKYYAFQILNQHAYT